MRPLLLATCVLAVLALAALADSVTLLTGVTHDGKVIATSETDVTINTFNSTMKEMTWGVFTFERTAVDRVDIVPEDPLRTYWQRMNDPGEFNEKLMRYCLENKLDVEAREQAAEVLSRKPDDPEARAAWGDGVEAMLKASPLHNPDLRAAVKDWSTLAPAARAAAYARLKKDFGVVLPPQYFDRAARSEALPRGVITEDVRLTYNTQKASGRYTFWVPKSYDPHRSYPLVLALHGTWNGLGGIGNGRDFIRHFTYAETQRWDVIIVSPTADPRPWTAKGDDFVLSVVDEAMLLWNIDMNRVYAIGHSMGGRGTYHFGAKYAPRFAAFAPAASGPGNSDLLEAAAQGTGMYIYHSSDDNIASCESDRAAAKKLRDAKVDFVYTEWKDQKHGWPQEVIADTFVYFKRHHRMEKGKDGPVVVHGTRPSFAEPLWPDEERYFPPRPPGAKQKLDDLLGEVLLGGTLAEKAADRLIEMKDRHAIAPLARIATDVKGACEEARREAARALRAVRDPVAVAAALKAQTDPEYKVRIAAMESLARIATEKDAIAIASALLVLGEEFDKIAAKWIPDEAWTQLHALNAAFVEALSAAGDARTWQPVADVSVTKILLTEAKSGSSFIDPEPARKAAAERILKALPGLKDAKLKGVLQAIRNRFDDEGINALADEAEKGLGG